MNSSSSAKSRNPLARFFSGLWAVITWTRIAVLNLIFLLLVLIIVLAIKSGRPAPLPETFALRLAPTGMLVDQRSYVDPTSLLLGATNPEETETVVRELVDAIHYAAEDKRVTALVLELDLMLVGSISKMQEIGTALNHFKTSGKKIVAVGTNYSQDQYYLASYADQIYMHDMGTILLTGYGRYGNYFKSAIDKLEINFHVFRSGKFKDAVEPLLRDDMSEESKIHNTELINQLWNIYTAGVETRRELPAGSINDYINNLDQKMTQARGDSAALAAEVGLIDEIASHQRINRFLIDSFGKSPEGEFYNGVDARVYLANIERFKLHAQNKIGLLVASGTIVDGKRPDGTIGSESFVDMLREVREDDSIKALVIRIDSGGGSAFASEVIRAEISAVREAGKPVFISMGSVAASGGYWMAAGGDEIWATPTTITGSIGVFGAFPTLEKTLGNLGIHTDGVGTTELSGSLRADRPLSPKISTIIQLSVDNIYHRFIRLVAEARKADAETIDRVAQGHVWSGSTAKDLGLVDHLGGLNEVIAAAAARVDLTDYRVHLVQQPRSPQELLMRQLMGNTAGALAPSTLLQQFTSLAALQEISPLLKPLAELRHMNDPQAIYAACIECVAP